MGQSEESPRLILKDASPMGGHPYRTATPSIVWVGEVAVDYDKRLSPRKLDGKSWFGKRNSSWFDEVDDYSDLPSKPWSGSEDSLLRGTETVRCGYVHLDRDVTPAKALYEIDRHGVKPATILETIYFGKMFPDEQRKHPVVGLGSFVGSRGTFAHLYSLQGKRWFGLKRGFYGVGFTEIARFLVRE